jgi:hypothetical protein
LLTLLFDSLLWIVLLVALAGAWWMNLLGLPGNWVIVGIAAAAAWLAPSGFRLSISQTIVYVLIGLALVGEGVEFAAGALGVKRAGGSRRGALYSLGGGLAGGMVGMFIGLPIPIIGSAIAAILFASFGAMAGAVIGENSQGRETGHSWQIGKAAFWGRLFGTLGKTAIGAAMVAIAAVASLI